MTCRRRRLFEAVPKQFRIRLEALRPPELLLGRVSLEKQSRLLDLIRGQSRGNFLLMGKPDAAKRNSCIRCISAMWRTRVMLSPT